MNRAVIAYAIRGNDTTLTYLSQIDVVLSLSLQEVTVECYREENNQLHLINSSTLSVGKPDICYISQYALC